MFSIVIPVYNRPEELDELLASITRQDRSVSKEVVIVEDGSLNTSENVVNQYKEKLNIKYCFKKNSGPGDSRNYGMNRASGDYFILLDSDCLLPDDYLLQVSSALERGFTDAFGGPDTDHPSFTLIQKAFNYAVTSFLSTGGLRSSESKNRKFQLRSFNMGLSLAAFKGTGGFAKQRIGEDIDLNFRLLSKGFTTQFLPEAYVYHKRRSDWSQFFKQTQSFGAARPILNSMHPNTKKLAFAFPSMFMVALILGLVLGFLGLPYFLIPFGLYFLAILIDATRKNNNLWVGILSCFAVLVQFTGYGSGYLRTAYRLRLLGREPKSAFPGMFS